MIDYILFCLLSVYVLWLFYLAVMNLKRAKDNGTISKTALYMGYPILFIGLLIDLITNVLVMSVLFLDLPIRLTFSNNLKQLIFDRDWWMLIKTVLFAEIGLESTVTARLSRHLQEGGWRKRLAHWFCSNLLDTFDPSGKHCN